MRCRLITAYMPYRICRSDTQMCLSRDGLMVPHRPQDTDLYVGVHKTCHSPASAFLSSSSLHSHLCVLFPHHPEPLPGPGKCQSPLSPAYAPAPSSAWSIYIPFCTGMSCLVFMIFHGLFLQGGFPDFHVYYVL